MNLIRIINTHELNQVLEIAESHYGSGFQWTKSLLLSEFEKNSVYGHFDNDQLMAFVVVGDRGSVAELTVLATRTGKRGWMRPLLADLIQRLTQYDEIWLEVHEGNAKAIQLYESLQFQMVGRRPRYYSDGAAAIQMTLKRTAFNI